MYSLKEILHRWPKHVGGYAVYAIVNLHICVCTCWSSHNESLLYDHESFKKSQVSYIKFQEG